MDTWHKCVQRHSVHLSTRRGQCLMPCKLNNSANKTSLQRSSCPLWNPPTCPPLALACLVTSLGSPFAAVHAATFCQASSCATRICFRNETVPTTRKMLSHFRLKSQHLECPYGNRIAFPCSSHHRPVKWVWSLVFYILILFVLVRGQKAAGPSARKRSGRAEQL